MKTIRNTPLKRTKSGNFVRNLGRLKRGSNAQFKFNLGRDEVAATQRRKWIETIYLMNCQYYGHNSWIDKFLDLAKQIASSGTCVFTVKPPLPELSHLCDPDYSWIDALRQQGVPIIVKGNAPFRGTLAEAVTRDNKPATIRFHAALDAYKKERVDDYVGTFQGKKRAEREVNKLYEIEDCWLIDFDYPRIKKFVDRWRARPETARGNRASKVFCENIICEFISALKSFDREYGEFDVPNLDGLKRTVQNLPSDSNGNEIKKFITPDEYKAAFGNATQPLTKLALALGLNTCSGPAELGRMKITDFSFNKKHPCAKIIRFEQKMNLLRTVRRKTWNHSEGLLWDWVADLVKQQIRVCKKNGWKYLFTDNGEPLYRCNEVYEDVGLPLPNTTKPESRFVSRWNKVKCPHSFGKLRKAFSNYLVQEDHADLGSLALSHKTDKDSLLKHYANKPYKRLFLATIEAEAVWKPF